MIVVQIATDSLHEPDDASPTDEESNRGRTPDTKPHNDHWSDPYSKRSSQSSLSNLGVMGHLDWLATIGWDCPMCAIVVVEHVEPLWRFCSPGVARTLVLSLGRPQSVAARSAKYPHCWTDYIGPDCFY